MIKSKNERTRKTNSNAYKNNNDNNEAPSSFNNEPSLCIIYDDETERVFVPWESMKEMMLRVVGCGC